MRKKGDLSLSINAIVILILAITMLGLGLAFMRNIFGKATGEFEEVSGTVQKQMIDQMKSSEKVVDISGAVYEIKPGEKKMAYIGFKNTGNTQKNFMINSINANSLSGITNNCGIDNSNVILEYKKTSTEVKPGATTVLPINIKAGSNAQKDSCFFEIKINTDYQGGNCSGPNYTSVPVSCVNSSDFGFGGNPAYKCTNSTDGILATKWVSANVLADRNPWVYFDLGKTKCINNVTILHNTTLPTFFFAAFFDENSILLNGFSLGRIFPNIITSIPFTEVSARYINITLTGIGATKSLNEIYFQTRDFAKYDQSIQLTVNVG